VSFKWRLALLKARYKW